MNLENAREAYYNKFYRPHLPSAPYSLLDLGCSNRNHTKYFDYFQCDAVDIRNIEFKNKEVYLKFHCMDVLDFLTENEGQRWDVVAALDLIEHMKKPAATGLLEAAKKAAMDCLIISAPDGFGPNGEFQGTKYLSHVCGFEESELKSLGFEIFREKGGRAGMKEWHDKMNVPYPKSWDRLIGVYKPR